MTKDEASKIISHFNKDNKPVFFLVEATPENIELIEEAKKLHKENKLKIILNG